MQRITRETHMEKRTWLIFGLIELVALAVGAVSAYFGLISWWVVPLFLLVPPVLLVIVLAALLIRASARGENPFQ